MKDWIAKELFPGSEIWRKSAFKNAASRVNCAILHVVTADLALSQDNCAHISRVECLSPRPVGLTI